MSIRNFIPTLVAVMIIVSIVSVCMAAPDTGTVRVEMTGFRNDRGKAMIALYNKKDGFPLDHGKALMKQKLDIKDGKAEAIFNDVPHGIYAIAAFHDENSNGKLDRNIFGKPVEGYAISNNPKKSGHLPRFDEAKFTLQAGELPMEIKMIY